MASITCFALLQLPSVILFHSHFSLALTKTNKMSLLALTPSAVDFNGGKACSMAMKIAVDTVNKRDDILSNYEIEAEYREEGVLSTNSPRAVIEFVSGNNASFISPVITGPFSYCQRASGLLKPLNMIQVSYGCTAATFTANRIRFPNLYRSTIPAEESFTSSTCFAKNVAKWNEIAMLGYAAMSNEYAINNQVYAKTIAAGITVLKFLYAMEVDDSIVQQMKETGARVIVLSTGNIPFVAKFLCLAYDHGMRGSRYAFMVPSFAFFSLDAVAFMGMPVCSREKMADQFKRIIWGGIFFSAVENTGNSSLGYDVPEFDRRLDSALNNSRTLDYSLRHACHDAMMESMLILHESEQMLNRVNLTLGDYRSQPDLIFSVVNSTAAAIKFRGLRAGEMSYSKRLELDSEPTWTAQAIDGVPKMLYKLSNSFPDSAVGFNLTSLQNFNVTLVNNVQWFTENGKPPKDLSNVVHKMYTLPKAAFYLGVILCSLVTSCQIALICICYAARSPRNTTHSNTTVSNLIVIFGGICCNFVSLNFLLFYHLRQENNRPLVFMCNFNVIALTIGVGLIVGCLFSRILILEYSGTHLKGPDIRKRRKAGIRPMPLSMVEISAMLNMPKRIIYVLKWNHSRFVGLGTFIFTSIEIVLLIIWLSGVDVLRIETMTSDIQFDANQDSYFDVTKRICTCDYFPAWGALASCIAMVLLIVSCYYNYIIRTAVPSEPLLREYKTVRIAIVNATLIFFCVSSSLFIVDGSRNTTLYLSIFTFGLLAFSVSTSAIVAYNSVADFCRRKLCRCSGF